MVRDNHRLEKSFSFISWWFSLWAATAPCSATRWLDSSTFSPRILYYKRKIFCFNEVDFFHKSPIQPIVSTEVSEEKTVSSCENVHLLRKAVSLVYLVYDCGKKTIHVASVIVYQNKFHYQIIPFSNSTASLTPQSTSSCNNEVGKYIQMYAFPMVYIISQWNNSFKIFIIWHAIIYLKKFPVTF